MSRVPIRVNSHHVLGLVAVIGLVTLLLFIWATVAQGAFQLEYVPGVEPTKGISVTRVTAQADDISYRGRTAAVSVSVAPKPVQQRTVAKASGGCYAESGTPPHSVMMRESGGSPTARNPSGAAGCWQIMPGTWNGYRGYPTADSAPIAVQNAKAKELWAGGAGCSHWRATASC